MAANGNEAPGAAGGGPLPAVERGEILANAVLLGERLDTRGMEQEGAYAAAPLVIAAGSGRAVLFRYGVVVFFGMNQVERSIFVDTITPRVAEALQTPERDSLRILVSPEAEETIDASGTLILRDLNVEHMQLVAEAMAKSLVLGRYESGIGGAFDRIEPLAQRLRRTGGVPSDSVELLRHVGDVLLAQHQMVGRVAAGDKPDVLWDYPRLERLYARLEDWYELVERERAVDRKLDIISRTASTLNDLLQHRRSLRVEWYIVILIVIEIILTLYQMTGG